MAPSSRALGALAVAVVATGAAVGGGVVLRSPDSPPAAAPSRPLATRLASIDTATIGVRRAGWCDRLRPADARAAVDDASPTAASWANGDPLGSGRDVAHEFGCSWTAASGAVASGWVFAPPVTPERAAELVASAQAEPGCAPLPGAATFGAPTLALSCTTDGTTTVSYRGLFGDAWLVCELAAPAPADPARLADRADRWCASVLLAARAGS